MGSRQKTKGANPEDLRCAPKKWTPDCGSYGA